MCPSFVPCSAPADIYIKSEKLSFTLTHCCLLSEKYSKISIRFLFILHFYSFFNKIWGQSLSKVLEKSRQASCTYLDSIKFNSAVQLSSNCRRASVNLLLDYKRTDLMQLYLSVVLSVY